MDKIKLRRHDLKEDRGSIIFKRDGNKEFIIHFEANLDLYFSLRNFDNDPTFYIGIDNFELYNAFDKLYQDIINGEIFDNYQNDDKEEQIKNNKYYAKSSRLVTNNKIIWLSDDYPEDTAPYFIIERLENSYKITFNIKRTNHKLDLEEELALQGYNNGYTSVRIRNSGTRYYMFNIPFMRLFNTLLKMEIDNHQIHIEEYLLDKRLDKGEKLEHILTLKK